MRVCGVVPHWVSSVVIVLLPPASEVCEGYDFTGVCLSTPGEGGHAWFYLGGMHGFIWGAYMVLFGGWHTWFYSGGHVWFYWGGMHGFIQQGCMVLLGGHVWFYLGGMHGFSGGGCAWFFQFFLDTMRYGQSAGGTHPTGMHSCYCCCLTS